MSCKEERAKAKIITEKARVYAKKRRKAAGTSTASASSSFTPTSALKVRIKTKSNSKTKKKKRKKGKVMLTPPPRPRQKSIQQIIYEQKKDTTVRKCPNQTKSKESPLKMFRRTPQSHTSIKSMMGIKSG
jgi:hypothetical protein